MIKSGKLSVYFLISVIGGSAWTLLLIGSSYWDVNNIKLHTKRISTFQARAFFQSIVTTRSWNASHNGVYVPVTDKTKPNRYLDIPGRDVTTTDGQLLTKINPSYMVRLISEIASKNNSIWFHITSENPIRPQNAPDEWELKTLKRFDQGASEFSEFVPVDGGSTLFRYMAPMWVQEDCLSCHEKQGYKKGELRGGISVTVNPDSIIKSQKHQIKSSLVTHFVIWLFGFLGIQMASYSLGKKEREKEHVIEELKSALDEVKKLSGLIPICANCKKIRDDSGYWNQIEQYIESHSEVLFSHGICNECADELYGEQEWYKKRKKKKVEDEQTSVD